MGWRKDAKEIIRRYPELQRRERELHNTSVTPSYRGMPGGQSAARTTENTALKSLPPGEQRELDAVQRAINTTLRYRNGELRLRVVDLVFWRGSHNLQGAALECHVAYPTAKAWHNDFVSLVDAFSRVL